MKIVMFAINPLFPHKVMGGAPKHLQNVAVHLGELGHEVTILCTRRLDTAPFHWHERVRVLPILQFKQPFPQPYDMPAYQMANNVQELAEHLAGADRFYMHDGEFLFPPLYQQVPTVISLRDNVYPETMLGSFLFRGDLLITISEYSRQVVLNTAGRFLGGLAERTVVIPNAIDGERFKPTPPSEELLRIVSADPDRDVIVLHPHRPEPSKGLPQTVEVVDLLVKRFRISNLKTLVPRWFDVATSAEVRAYYEGISAEIKSRGLTEHFIFHDWIPQALMPEYYSLGSVTLTLGHFVEAFGNVPYESLSCGTPAVVARVSTHREVLPDQLVYKVHFGDAETAAGLAARAITQREGVPAETLAYLRQYYGIRRQLAAYAEAVLNAEKRDALTYRFTPLGPETHFKLAPWCYTWDNKVYHDFLATHQTMEALCALAHQFPESFGYAEAAQLGASAGEVKDWYRQGYVVPYLLKK